MSYFLLQKTKEDILKNVENQKTLTYIAGTQNRQDNYQNISFVFFRKTTQQEI